MSRRFMMILAALGLLALAWAAPPLVVAGDPCFHEMDNRPAPTTGAIVQISLGDCVFLPTVSHVAVGTTVTWRNNSSQEHEVLGANLSWGAHGKLLAMGDQIGWTFEQPGIYPYSCMIHPGMTGAIVVGDGGSADAAGAPAGPAGDAAEPADAAPAATAATTGSGVSGAVVVAGTVGVAFGLFGLAALAARRRTAEV